MKIGIDVGGTKCLGVAVDDSGKVVQQYRLPTPHADALCDTLVEIVAQLGEFNSIGIGVPGLISPEGVIRASPNLVGAKELALRQMMQDRLAKKFWWKTMQRVRRLANGNRARLKVQLMHG